MTIILTTRFNGKCILGDQDWLTLLSWKMPTSFFKLPCAFNYVIGMVKKQLHINVNDEKGCLGT